MLKLLRTFSRVHQLDAVASFARVHRPMTATTESVGFIGSCIGAPSMIVLPGTDCFCSPPLYWACSTFSRTAFRKKTLWHRLIGVRWAHLYHRPIFPFFPLWHKMRMAASRSFCRPRMEP